MLKNILQKSLNSYRIILQEAQCSVASVTQKTSYHTRLMAMIDCQFSIIGKIWTLRLFLGALTCCTSSTLCMPHSFIVCFRKVVVALQPWTSLCIASCMRFTTRFLHTLFTFGPVTYVNGTIYPMIRIFIEVAKRLGISFTLNALLVRRGNRRYNTIHGKNQSFLSRPGGASNTPGHNHI